jgi:hypothetical protein
MFVGSLFFDFSLIYPYPNALSAKEIPLLGSLKSSKGIFIPQLSLELWRNWHFPFITN